MSEVDCFCFVIQDVPVNEAMHMMRKEQVKGLNGRDSAGQALFVACLSGIAAREEDSRILRVPRLNVCDTTASLVPQCQDQIYSRSPARRDEAGRQHRAD